MTASIFQNVAKAHSQIVCWKLNSDIIYQWNSVKAPWIKKKKYIYNYLNKHFQL